MLSLPFDESQRTPLAQLQICKHLIRGVRGAFNSRFATICTTWGAADAQTIRASVSESPRKTATYVTTLNLLGVNRASIPYSHQGAKSLRAGKIFFEGVSKKGFTSATETELPFGVCCRRADGCCLRERPIGPQCPSWYAQPENTQESLAHAGRDQGYVRSP